MASQIARFIWPTWGPPGSCRPQMGPSLAPWTLLSGQAPDGPLVGPMNFHWIKILHMKWPMLNTVACIRTMCRVTFRNQRWQHSHTIATEDILLDGIADRQVSSCFSSIRSPSRTSSYLIKFMPSYFMGFYDKTFIRINVWSQLFYCVMCIRLYIFSIMTNSSQALLKIVQLACLSRYQLSYITWCVHIISELYTIVYE